MKAACSYRDIAAVAEFDWSAFAWIQDFTLNTSVLQEKDKEDRRIHAWLESCAVSREK